jgi:hypothetical protein
MQFSFFLFENNFVVKIWSTGWIAEVQAVLLTPGSAKLNFVIFLVRDRLYRNPCVCVILCICCMFSVFRIVNATSTYASLAPVIDQLYSTNSCTTSVQCTEAGINSRINVPSKVCALRCPKCAWGSRTPARFVVLVDVICVIWHQNYDVSQSGRYWCLKNCLNLNNPTC